MTLLSTALCATMHASDANAAAAPPRGGWNWPNTLSTREDVARFLIKAGNGADMTTLNALTSTDAADWVAREFAKPRTPMLAPLLARQTAGEPVRNDEHANVFWDALLQADDVLRQRMVYALSQFFVVSDKPFGAPAFPLAHYQEQLSRHAFGNFRDLLEAVTYAPAMAQYLTYLRNEKADPASGRVPDENYAREILQLFSIGLVALNLDGTPALRNGQQIETYDNTDIEGLARVFTGLSLAGPSFYTPASDGEYQRLVMYDAFHAPEQKRFLDTVIPAGTAGDASIRLALDAIFAHPNVAPFFARQLIQRFTDSDPSPGYVRRVAIAFNQGRFRSANGTVFGTGRRGDLQATLAAVLLHGSVFRPTDRLWAGDGKLREPVLKFAQWTRAFRAAPIITDIEYRLFLASRADIGLDQHPFRARSVFNFYRPGYVAPGTLSGDRGFTTPEFQLVNEGSINGYVNFMTDFIFNQTGTSDGSPLFDPDYSAELALAGDARALVNRLNLLLTAGQMSDAEIEAVTDTIETLAVENEALDRPTRVEAAITLVISLPSYAVIR